MSDVLLLGRDGPLTRVTLNRPDKANALDAALVDALLDAVRIAHADGTRLLVIEPGPKCLSAGFDFSGYEQQSDGDLLARFVRIEQLLQAVHHAPFATLALARGRNFGAGADLFAAAAVRVAAPGTSFRMPGLRFGLQLGTRRLAARIGADRARAMLADSRTITAEQALDWGFATLLAAESDWPALVEAELARACALTPQSQARLNAATLTDTRAADMADLVDSVMQPGLKARIADYRAGA